MKSLSTLGAIWLIVAMSFFGGSAFASASTGLPAAVVAGALRTEACPGGARVGGGANLGGVGASAGWAAGAGLAVCDGCGKDSGVKEGLA